MIFHITEKKPCVERIFPEALVLHFKHPKPQNSSLEHNPLWPKTPDQFKLCLSKKCKMYFDAHPLLQKWEPQAIKSAAYPGLTFDVPGLYFIQCTAAFLVVLLLKTTTQLQHELPEAIFIDQTNHCAVCEGVFLTNQTFSHSFQTWSLRETIKGEAQKCTWELGFLTLPKPWIQ